MKLFKVIKKYIDTRCWHEFEVISVFTQRMQNGNERPIICESQKCIKCGATRVQKFWKDLYY